MTNNKYNKYLAGASIAIAGAFAITSQTWATPVNTAFKDDKFYSCIYQSWNSYGRTESEPIANETTNLTDAQLAAITRLSCDSASFAGISDISGIEKLTGLTQIQMNGGTFTSIDLSKSPNLTNVEITSSALTSVNLSKNTALTNLNLFDNKLASIDLSNNTALTTLVLSKNSLTTLDVSKNTKLNYIFIYDNKLTTIDLTALPSYRSNWGSNSNSTTGTTPGNIYADNILVKIGLRAIQYGDVFYADTSGVQASLGFGGNRKSRIENTSSVKYYYIESEQCPIVNLSTTGSCIAISNLSQYPGYVQLTSLNNNSVGIKGMDQNKLTMKLEIVPVENTGGSSSDSGATSGIKVPNTGLFTSENAGAIILISTGAVLVISLSTVAILYSKKRLSNQVKFNKK